MKRSPLSWRIIIIAATLCTAVQAQLNVLTSGGFRAAYLAVLPEFEKTSGITVTTGGGPSQGDGPTTIAAQLRRGVPADVVIMSRDGLSELIRDGRIDPGSDVDLARVVLGVAVRTGAPRPDIRTVDAFRQTVLRARSIGVQSSSAIFLNEKVFPRLGISEAVAKKLSSAGAASVAKGETEMVILPVSEILPVPGVTFVGTIPAEIQQDQMFSAAVVKGAHNAEAARRLIAFLASEQTTAALEKVGMLRPHSR